MSISYTTTLLLSLVLICCCCCCCFVSAAVVEDLCTKTRDPNFCKTVLGRDTRTKAAGMFDLTLVAIDLASTAASNTKAKIHTLRLSETNNKLKYYYEACESYYENSLDGLSIARDHLKKQDYVGVNEAASEVEDDASYCEDALNSPPFKSAFTKENSDLQLLADIVINAANLL
ncbi:hypothetical protein ACP275_09G030700 [Erythranthe tilingii]